MDHRSEDIEFVRSVGSPSVDEETVEKNIPTVNDGDSGSVVDGNGDANSGTELLTENGEDDADLPQCKIKRNYSCNLCPFFSQNPRSFLYHSRDVHFDRIKIYECSQCLYASKHSQKLQRHINMIHVPGKTRKTRNRMMRPDRKEPRPIRPKPADESPEPPVKVFTLLTDEQKSKTENENGEEFEKTAEGEFKCSICNFKNRNSKLLRRHEKIVHLKKRYLKCTKCSYVTHVTARFTKHVKYHSMPMIKCDLCDFRTPYKWNLDRHYKNHSGSGAFQCAKCNFRADIKQSLTVHEMNHHVPPVGQGAAMARKRNKVGSSEAKTLDADSTSKDELDLEKNDPNSGHQEVESEEEQITEKVQKLRNVKPPYNSKRETANNNHLQTDFIHPDDIVPRYGQIFVKNLKCKFCSYKAVFSHEIWRHEKRIHGYIRPECKKGNAAKRPPPQLIPIQNKSNSGAILKIPTVKNKSGVSSLDASPVEKPVNETEFNEMCKKSSLTSSLKDFVSLIGDEEGLKTIPDSSREELEAECSGWVSEPAESAESKDDDVSKQKQTDLLKKKNASFFDKLKEKLLTGNNEEQSLFCEICGHESKCLSKAVAHQKRHSTTCYKSDSDSHAENDIVLSGAELSSTRCQHCRQRCKTSTDLINHLKSCKAFEASQDSQSNADNFDETKSKTGDISSERETKPERDGTSSENKVFVWNDLSQIPKNTEEENIMEEEEEGDWEMDAKEEFFRDEDMDEDMEGMMDDEQLKEIPLTTSPGYGTVTSKGSDNTVSGTIVMKVDPRLHVIIKKVFKCPHCSFWASTASRFHVHIVGHLNKKPFECSLCLYRSNWRWDITKHIRLKSLRDPSHSQAKVNMTDETGRRNYSKYNRFLTMMRVQEPTAESSGYGRRSRCGDATQGTVTDKDIIPLPAPPRLTRAPVVGTPQQVPPGVPLRPPPPLKAAHNVSEQSSLVKESKDFVKKTFWKCKKCNYRDTQKGRVLSHVKKHYKNEKTSKSRASASSNGTSSAASGDQSNSNPELRSLLKTPSYSCGHCHQVSHWKHVIQRHCKLKHNGDSLIEVNYTDQSATQSDNSGENQGEAADNAVKTISCDICPFTADSEGDLTAHKLNHVDRPGSIFKCTYCPFYVPSKTAVLEHIEIHGFQEGCDVTDLKVDSFDPKEELVSPKCGSQKDNSKKYKCLQCPYISNSRTQFLYHKQFHRPRNSPFKCLYCSYNVSRRHLLHQHLRVHHNREEKFYNFQETETYKESEKAKKDKNSGKDASVQDDQEVPEIPLVWVLKSGTIQKMFKCRHCPLVNTRKMNIIEHEKMHQEYKKNGTNGGSKLKCSDCSYTCNSAGVLASHTKVHQGLCGEIRCFVDPNRSDSEQIKELQNSLNSPEPKILPADDQLEIEETDSMSVQLENSSSQVTREEINEESEENKKILSFCDKCPARFFFKKELKIHSKFHTIHLPFRCSYCSYTARQRPHLLAHYKVHGQEYQEKTRGLVRAYTVSSECSQPKTIIFSREAYVTEGPVWVVKTIDPKKPEKPLPKHACHRCPAKFFKSLALQYHLTLHGGSHQHKCKYCDYTVKTYGNLMKHQLVHGERSKRSKKKSPKGFSYSFPLSGKDLDQEEIEVQCYAKENEKHQNDSRLEEVVEDSPEPISSTQVKKGKIKVKRYKCNKCPSDFEKRDQYRAHLTLHGSNQKYKCEKCDFSVKHHADFAQHMKNHENQDEASKPKNSYNTSDKTLMENTPKVAEVEEIEDDKKPYELTLLEKQTLLLQEKKRSMEGRDEERKTYYCGYCPYYSIRKDAIENHSWRHYLVSGMKSGFECMHCDYSATQNNFLQEHIKVHFNSMPRYKAEAYLKCEKMELWSCDEDAKDPKQLLIFQDKGEEEAERFHPPVENDDSDQNLINCQVCPNPQPKKPEKKNENPPQESPAISGSSQKQLSASEVPPSSQKEPSASGNPGYLGKELPAPGNPGSPDKELSASGKPGSPTKELPVSGNPGSPTKELPVSGNPGSPTKELPESGNPGSPREAGNPDSPRKEISASENPSSPPASGNQCPPREELPASGNPGSLQKEHPALEILSPPRNEHPALEIPGSIRIELPALEIPGYAQKERPVLIIPGFLRKEHPVLEISGSPRKEELLEMIEEEVQEVQVKAKPKKLRGKNWKCKKCPHAFVKKEQFLKHITLHGSNQKHECDICDYSVKFYTNYVQHMRMHQRHEPNRVIHVKKNFPTVADNTRNFASDDDDDDDNSQDDNLVIDENRDEDNEDENNCEKTSEN